MITNIEQMVIM